MRQSFWLLCMVFILLTQIIFAQEPAGLLRFPAISKDKIVFTYAGDLYLVESQGGVARKITNHDGFEMFARFSPDGKNLAFTGQYDGNTEIYLMPAEGGIPKRLTYTATLDRDDVSDRMGPNNIVMGWKSDNKTIIFRSRMKEFNSFKGQLFTVTTDGDIPTQLPFSRGGFCAFSNDGKLFAYNRVFREFRTWKRYRGGMADDIWLYHFDTQKTENITNIAAQDVFPMFAGQKIYFLSDRDENKRMNLFVYDLSSKSTRQLTFYKDFDIKFPSIGPDAIVFENGGFLYRFDLATEKAAQVPIFIKEDRLGSRTRFIEVSQNISNFEIAPDGKRALFGARGEIFTIPAEHGPTRNLSNTSGIHERNSKWSPDGKWIAYTSDSSGEDEIYITSQDGKGAPQKITSGSETYMYEILWSPDSKKLLWGDKRLRLRYVDIQTKNIVDVVKAESWEIRDYSWSPDSKWIAYTRPEVETMPKVYIYSLENKQSYEVTDGWYASSQPIFSSDGKFLFFVSNRDYNPIFSATEWNHVYQDMARIYLVTLNKSVDSPFKPQSDEVEIKKEEAKPEDKSTKTDKKGDSEKTAKKETIEVKVDVDGLKDRIAALPLGASNYWNLGSVGENLYYFKRGIKNEKTTFYLYDLKKLKETELGQIDGYEISADQKKMLVAQQRSYAIIDLPKGKIDIKDKLNLSDLKVQLNREAEWNQIYHECWRQMREFFYAPNMHGVNWPGVREKYAPLLKQVNHRADLTYLIGEMIGELNTGHTYVGGGDMPHPERIKTGLLGAQLERDAQSKYYRIKKILKGQNWDKSLRSPLTEIGVNAAEGDYILAVNGQPTNQMTNIYQALIHSVGKQITLKLNSKPVTNGSRDVVVIPTGDELNLYYYNWVQKNIEKVSAATQNKVGYIHVPDMSTAGLNEFVKHFYPQLRKKALIIDVRGNGGGNVSPMLIERLRREIAMIDMARNTVPGTDPGGLLYGPKICLLDEFSASDGDLFPYRFKQHKLGKLVGKRTWGGVVGIRGSLPLLDGGYLNKPEYASYDLAGKEWIIEGRGVAPDIEVENDPAEEFLGKDAQLDRAIQEILDELKIAEKSIPPIPPYPVK
ncbi:PD40 domain-containing protein [candidate division KSB1 bacterium]|nr:PD40 domain-containing protein [candidate division KSB1 bacterium]